MKKIVLPITLVLACVILSGWGWRGHRKISQGAMSGLPTGMYFLHPSWSAFVGNHASDADYRKDNDPDESPRHYIDIDNYPEFIQSGYIHSSYDSAVAAHGYYFVMDQGILPWATLRTFDSLKSCFQRRDWNRSALFAADLGHYVGDGHMPLHLTRNYDGQYSGQSGIHSRYETKMISRYEGQIQYTIDSAWHIPDVTSFVFNYIYGNYAYVDSLLIADSAAYLATGSITSDAYYQSLWEKTGPFTVNLLKNASSALTSLIFTAWLEAGSPMMYPNNIGESERPGQAVFLKPYPNPSAGFVIFPFVVPVPGEAVVLRIFDADGQLEDTITYHPVEDGINKVKWTTEHLVPGVYLCVIQVDGGELTRKFVVQR